jgi:hypothetical protein
MLVSITCSFYVLRGGQETQGQHVLDRVQGKYQNVYLIVSIKVRIFGKLLRLFL